MLPINQPQLEAELAAAGYPYRVGLDGDTPYFVGDGGSILQVEQIEPEAQAVVAAHDPQPQVIHYVASQAVSAMLRTLDDQAREVFRFPTKPKHVYGAALRMTAVDATSGATKRARADMTFKGLASSVVQVGTTVSSTPMQDPAAASWVIQPTTDGADLIISVKGAAGRAVDWTLAGEVEVFAPEGLEA